jgi:hypothetical protein
MYVRTMRRVRVHCCQWNSNRYHTICVCVRCFFFLPRVVQPAKCMRRILCHIWPVRAVFYIISNSIIFGKKFTEHKMLFYLKKMVYQGQIYYTLNNINQTTNCKPFTDTPQSISIVTGNNFQLMPCYTDKKYLCNRPTPAGRLSIVYTAFHMSLTYLNVHSFK